MNKADKEDIKTKIPSYPKINSKAISINPDGYSLEGDEVIYRLYTDSIEKNGFMKTFNELKEFINETSKERCYSLERIIHHEKWFKKGIEHITEFRPFRANQNKDEEKVNELNESYPKIHFDNFLEEYEGYPSFKLADMIYYIDRNIDYFKQVTAIKLARDAKKLRSEIIHFDKMNFLNERTKDLVELILEKEFIEKIEDHRFIRSKAQIMEEEKERAKQKAKIDKGGRPEHVNDEYIAKYVVEWLDKARKGDPQYKSLIWQTETKKGQVHYARVAQMLINSSEVEKIDKDTYRNKSNLDEKVSAIVREKGI